MQVGIDNQSNFEKTFFYVSLVQDPLFLGVEVGGGVFMSVSIQMSGKLSSTCKICPHCFVLFFCGGGGVLFVQLDL